jgi:hypothetical protein
MVNIRIFVQFTFRKKLFHAIHPGDTEGAVENINKMTNKHQQKTVLKSNRKAYKHI